MSKLIISLDGAVLAEYEMSKERYTIGRLPDNDIHIDNMAVSGHHALIINILNDSFLEDLNSTNGTYVNGRLIKKYALQNDDVITIGRHTLRYVSSATATSRAGNDDEFERTMIIRPGAGPSLENVNRALRGSGQAPLETDAQKRLPRARLQVLDGAFAGKELELNKALTTLGRPGVQVAAITRRSDGFFVVPVEGDGSTPPRVNDSAVGREGRKLQDRDVIELAGVEMGFYELA